MEIKPIHIVLIFALALGVKGVIRYFNNDSVYRGHWYTVKVPEGWHKKVEKNTVVFISPAKDPLTDMPEAVFSIYGVQSKGALFLDDLFSEVLKELGQSQDGRILDASRQGGVKIDGEVAKWVLYYREKQPRLMILTFFIVDDFNRLTKIQFITAPKNFQKYRNVFEKFKQGIKFKKLF